MVKLFKGLNLNQKGFYGIISLYYNTFRKYMSDEKKYPLQLGFRLLSGN